MIRHILLAIALTLGAASAFAQPALTVTTNINGTTTPTSSGTAMRVGNTTIDLTASGLLPKGLTAYDHLAAVIDLQPGMAVTQSDALSGYVINHLPFDKAHNNGAGVAIWGRGISAVDGSKTWGLALLVDDIYNAQGPLGRLIQNEIDMGANHTNTQVVGMAMSAGFSVQPTNADGFIVGSFNATNRWINGFRTYDNSSVTAFLAGQAAPTGAANVQSQPIAWRSAGADAAQHDVRLYGYGGAQLVVDGDRPMTLRLMGGNSGILLDPTGRTGTSLQSQRITLASVDANGASHATVIVGDVDGQALVNGTPMPLSRTPPSSTARCTPGALASDANYIYACVPGNIWKRAPLSAF